MGPPNAEEASGSPPSPGDPWLASGVSPLKGEAPSQPVWGPGAWAYTVGGSTVEL